jgi:hypothetical protein
MNDNDDISSLSINEKLQSSILDEQILKLLRNEPRSQPQPQDLIDPAPIRPKRKPDTPYIPNAGRNNNNDDNSIYRMLSDFKDPIYMCIVFMVLQMAIVTEFIKGVVPYTAKSDFALMMIKGSIFVSILFIIKHCDIITIKSSS